MGNFLRVCIAVILIISFFTVSVFATPTGTYDMYSYDGRTVVGSSGSGNQYIGNFTRSLAYLNLYVNNIISTLDYYIPTMSNNIHYIHVALVDAFSPGAGDSRNMWTLMSQAVSGITAIQSAALGIAQDVYNISTYVDGIEGKLDTLHSDNTSSNSKLDTLHSDLNTINTNIDEVETKLGTTNTLLYNTNSSLTSINSNTDQIEGYVDGVESSLNSINSTIQSLENIKWSDFVGNLSFSFDGINYGDINSINGSSSYKTLYVKFNSNNVFTDSLVNICIPVYLSGSLSGYNNFEIEFYYGSRQIYPEYYNFLNYRSTNIFVFPFNTIGAANNMVLKINYDNFIYCDSSLSEYMYTRKLGFNDSDFYLVHNFLSSYNNTDTAHLEDIKNILIDIDNNNDFIQNNNDLQIDVDIDASEGRVISNIILKIQDLFDFGVSLQQFLVGLNEFDNLNWFTSVRDYNQVNYNPSNNLGYQDLYD